MKIEKIIFTIDDNPHYRGFWSSISRHCLRVLGLRSKLFVIGSQADAAAYDTSSGEVEIVAAVPGVPMIIQALMGKFWFTTTEPETTWLVGDLDLYPLQSQLFTSTILDIPDDRYAHLNPAAYGSFWRLGHRGLAGYYHVGKGRVIGRDLRLGDSFAGLVRRVAESGRWGIRFHDNEASPESKAASPDWGWFCCEEMYAGEMLRGSTNLVEVHASSGFRRLDRSDLHHASGAVASGAYVDLHAPRPYEQHQHHIESILALVPSHHD